MRIAVACDHAGYPLKDEILNVPKILGLMWLTWVPLTRNP